VDDNPETKIETPPVSPFKANCKKPAEYNHVTPPSILYCKGILLRV
jgi:hypothetical protein